MRGLVPPLVVAPARPPFEPRALQPGALPQVALTPCPQSTSPERDAGAMSGCPGVLSKGGG